MTVAVRSTTLSLKFCNAGKRCTFERFVNDCKIVLQATIDELWQAERLPSFFSAQNHGTTSLTATALQAVGKQACQIVRGERNLAKRMGRPATKPVAKNVVIDLDERFVSLETNTAGEFDAWLTVKRFTSLGGRKAICVEVPLRRTRHFNKLLSEGWTLKRGVKLDLRMNCIVFHFEKEIVPRIEGETVGIDVGIADVISDSRGHRTSDFVHPHGWTMSKVLQNLQRKKKGSKGFKRAQSLRDNFTGWAVNRLNLDNVKVLKLENIKHLKRGKTVDGFRRGWSYPKIFDRLKRRAEEQNVSVSLVNPRNTSRKCSVCGAIDAKSRRGKSFKCVACGHTGDADLNAALNIERAVPVAPLRGVYSPSCRETK